MTASQKFCLKWNNFQNSVTSVFDLRQDEELVDITLCCEGKKIKAHRMMLSACSPYFRELFRDNPCQHPLFFLKDTSYADIAAVVEFVYKGEVNVLQSQLASFLKTAELLQVKGLSGDEDEDQAPRSQPPPSPRERPPDRSRLSTGLPPPPPGRPRPREPTDAPASPHLKRRRLSGSSDGRPGSPALVQHVQSAVSAPPPAATGPVPRDPASDGTVVPPAAAALPPPPPPAPPLTPATGSELAAPIQHGPPTPVQPVVQQGYGVKVEKIDIADDDDDDDASIEATLGQVSTFEASQFDGSDQDHSASSSDMAGLLGRAPEQGGSDLLSASAAGEDGVSQDVSGGRKHLQQQRHKRQEVTTTKQPKQERPSRTRCPDCGRDFTPASFQHHLALHRGKTRCPLCHKVFATRQSLRYHVRQNHPGRHLDELEEPASQPDDVPPAVTRLQAGRRRTQQSSPAVAVSRRARPVRRCFVARPASPGAQTCTADDPLAVHMGVGSVKC